MYSIINYIKSKKTTDKLKKIHKMYHTIETWEKMV